jgi:hypothetical protein
LTDVVFASAQQVIGVPLSAAQVRLGRLLYGGWLSKASDEAYRHSADDLLRVGPFGDTPGTSRLVRVRFTDPAYRDDELRIGLRWEAVGVAGGLFPALDADISLSADGEGTRVGLTGTYRPPLGALGTGLDRLVLRNVAAATIAAFLNRLSSAIEDGAIEDGAIEDGAIEDGLEDGAIEDGLVVDGPDRPAAGGDRVAIEGDAPR